MSGNLFPDLVRERLCRIRAHGQALDVINTYANRGLQAQTRRRSDCVTIRGASPQGGMSWLAHAVLLVLILSFSLQLYAAVWDLLSWERWRHASQP